MTHMAVNCPDALAGSLRSAGVLACLIFTVALAVLVPPVVHGASATAPDLGTIDREGLVSADTTEAPIREILASLSRKTPLDITWKTAVPEKRTIHFSGLDLTTFLRRLMSGYNYVLVEPDHPGGRVRMTVIGRAERASKDAVSLIEAAGPSQDDQRARRPGRSSGEGNVPAPAPVETSAHAPTPTPTPSAPGAVEGHGQKSVPGEGQSTTPPQPGVGQQPAPPGEGQPAPENSPPTPAPDVQPPNQ
jgi:hypothetical protein